MFMASAIELFQRITAKCDISSLSFDSTDQLPPLDTIIGQERAIRSLEFGLGIRDHRFNVFVSGQPGTGKTTAIKKFLEKYSASMQPPEDLCYVYNFKDPSRPEALLLDNGLGERLQQDMRDMIWEVKRDISRAFASPEYAHMRMQLIQDSKNNRDKQLKQLNAIVESKNFQLKSTPTGLSLMASGDGGEPMSEDAFSALSADGQQDILQNRQYLETHLKQTILELRIGEKEINDRISAMDRGILQDIIDVVVIEVKKRYDLNSQVLGYLDEVSKDILVNKDLFVEKNPEEQRAEAGSADGYTEDTMRRYDVNVLVSNANLLGAPVVHEINPTFNNLFGTMEAEAQLGVLKTDFTMIRPGSIHNANGGFLMISAEDLLRDQRCWEGLKRCMREKKIVVDDILDHNSYVTTKRLIPEPIPLNVKVILIGSGQMYHMLYDRDSDFVELFKVKSDFDNSMERNSDNIRDYAAFISNLCREDGLLHLDKSAVARIIEHSSRLSGHQDKLSTRFAEISDIIREANYWATKLGVSLIGVEQINTAIKEKTHRSDLVQDKVMDMIESGVVDISTNGSIVGQVNGLAVMGIGDFSFGRPGRITVSISAGRDGLLDIERESNLGGRIHTKGIMILGGYLSDRYAQNIPLTMSARITFEQSYQEIDGDSASSTELYAILSKLSGIPIKQGFAVTGSVNQFGEVQAIGGVNEKVEGFFRICKDQGLNGEQGVLIPATNVNNLMLDDEVVEAVRNGQFHIYAIPDIASGIEILTGQPYGAVLSNGSFTEGSISDKVHNRLIQLAKDTRDFVNKDVR